MLPTSTQALLYWLRVLFAGNRPRLLGGALLALGTAISGMALLGLSGWFISATALAGMAMLAGLPFLLDIYLPGGGIRFFALSRTVSRYIERVYNHDTVLRQLAKSRLALFQGLQAMSRRHSAEHADADWLNRLTAELETLDNLYLRLLLPPVVALLALSLFCLVLALWLPKAALLLWIGSVLIGFVAGRRFLSHNHRSGEALAQAINQSRIASIEHLRAVAELRVSQQAAIQQDKLKKQLQQLYQLELQLQQSQRRFQFGLQSLNVLLFCSLLLVVLHATSAQLITGPVAVMFVLGWLGVSELLLALSASWQAFGKIAFAARRLAQLAQSPAEPATTKCELKSLTLTVKDYPQVLISRNRIITLQLNPATPWLLLTGPSGCGKSTLAAAIAGEISQPGLALSINEQMLPAKPRPDYTEQLGYLPQQNTVFADTLRYNLQLGLPPQQEEKLWQVLALVELENWASNLPRGLDSWLGETGEALSGGQARRLTLARLLLREPRLVILDEPFNGLDANTATKVWQNLQPWLSQRLLLLILHHKPAELVTIEQFKHVDLTASAAPGSESPLTS
jgi:ATP-binding cassette subfamily C protein CydC